MKSSFRLKNYFVVCLFVCVFVVRNAFFLLFSCSLRKLMDEQKYIEEN